MMIAAPPPPRPRNPNVISLPAPGDSDYHSDSQSESGSSTPSTSAVDESAAENLPVDVSEDQYDGEERKRDLMGKGISFLRGQFLDLHGFTFPGRWAVTMKRPPKSAPVSLAQTCSELYVLSVAY